LFAAALAAPAFGAPPRRAMTGAASRLPRALAAAARWRSLAWRGAVCPGPSTASAQLHGLAGGAAPAPRPATPPRGTGAARAAFGGARPKPKGTKAPRETFLCGECGDNFAQSHGKCPSCDTWDRHVTSSASISAVDYAL
jgi:hypothetical protein